MLTAGTALRIAVGQQGLGQGSTYNAAVAAAIPAATAASGDGRVVIALQTAPVVSPTPVPTASSVGLMALALLLGVAGMRRVRRTRGG